MTDKSTAIPTSHITDGKSSMVVNECDFKAGKYKGFSLVGSKKAKSAKAEAKPAKGK